MKTYFFKNNINDLIKIGRSENPETRAKHVTGQCPFIEISVFYVLDGDFESDFHKLYKNYRKSGEWFDLKDLTIIKICNDFEEFIKPNIKVQKEQDRSFLNKNGYSTYYAAFVFTLMRVYGQVGREIMSELDGLDEPIDSIDVKFPDGTLIINKGGNLQKEGLNKIKGIVEISVNVPTGSHVFSLLEKDVN